MKDFAEPLSIHTMVKARALTVMNVPKSRHLQIKSVRVLVEIFKSTFADLPVELELGLVAKKLP